MPYPKDWLLDLKYSSQVDIVKVVRKYIPELKHTPVKRGGGTKEYVALCPFHAEKTPSFFVTGSKQFYHCFGCGAHGSVFQFLMEYKGSTFPEAVREIAKMAGVKLPYLKRKKPIKKG